MNAHFQTCQTCISRKIFLKSRKRCSCLYTEVHLLSHDIDEYYQRLQSVLNVKNTLTFVTFKIYTMFTLNSYEYSILLIISCNIRQSKFISLLSISKMTYC